MTGMGSLQILLFFVSLFLLVRPLGSYMYKVFENKPCGLDKIVGPIETGFYRLCSITPEREMNWKNYLIALLGFNLLGVFLLYALQRLQGSLPFNPQHFANVSPDLAFNTAVSFVTNTDWQAYSGESTLSYFTQMVGLTVQNFLSAGTGLALLIALTRGITRSETSNVGNFWVDLVRSVLYILLPLSIIFAIILSGFGVIQNLKPYQTINVLQPFTYQTSDAKTATVTQQIIPMGPVASQEAIKQLGTNGGGFFTANSAHPFENPNPITNFLECLALLLIPAALTYTFGKMVNDLRQGAAIFISMLLIFIPALVAEIYVEQQPVPSLVQMHVQQEPNSLTSGGNMEGKETRFGIVSSSLWNVAATATGNGALNSALDSATPVGGMIPLWLIDIEEVIFGGVGSGLYSMIIFVIIAVFIAGLMVGRTPEYLGKKIEPYEVKMASVIILIVPFVILLLTAATVCIRKNMDVGNPGAHGFTEILYTFSSITNNNGSAMAGLNANTIYYNVIGGIAMLVGRFWVAIPVLAIAGSLARKKIIPSGSGTLPTHNLLFILILVGVIILMGALTFLPALALGPIVEQLMLGISHGH